jgi:nigerose phosphorylase
LNWKVEDLGFHREKVSVHGSKYMIGNGYLGYRGTLEEFGKDELAACTLAGLYDQAGESWRELVNAPNGLAVRLWCDGEPLHALTSTVAEHAQSLDLAGATHRRVTEFVTGSGKRIRIESERFASMDQMHLLSMRYAWSCSEACEITVRTGIDGAVWDINGPHLHGQRMTQEEGVIAVSAVTGELGRTVAVAEGLLWEQGEGLMQTVAEGGSAWREGIVKCVPGLTYRFVKFAVVYSDADETADPVQAAVSDCRKAIGEGYEGHRLRHVRQWERKWAASDVRIEGDEEAQLALRYSLYQLLIIAPYHSERLSIPARGLSGQVYKGAVFWDTEMFMLPFFLHTQPDVARNLVMYRVHTLDGARRKAREYGYRGAFYAWESQDTGDDACTLFNITDVFTNRPMRTYFRDKQIHISADAAFGIWQYYMHTGDRSVLWDGGAEVILECARFFFSYSRFNTDLNRFELLDVTGPDEYHERVHNNAFTNAMAMRTLDTAVKMLDILETENPEACRRLIAKLEFKDDRDHIARMRTLLYVPSPDPNTLLVEQFDGYFKQEDVTLSELKSRILHKNEYLGGGNGIVTTTRILKQADVVLMMHLFPQQFSREVKKANWDFYEPRTEHGSSLSPCVYALVASNIGYSEWAYPYFLKTATVDLTGESKQYVGTLYIGGTHPAANGGAWMAAVQGFAGLRYEDGLVNLQPSLPDKWTSIGFKLILRGQQYELTVTRSSVRVMSAEGNQLEQPFRIGGAVWLLLPGKEVHVPYVSTVRK